MDKRLISLVVWLCVATAAWAQKNQLNLFIWSEYIDPQIIADFEREYDCKVTIDLYEDNEAMLARLQGGGVALYDICVPSDYIIPALLQLQLLAPLRHENIPNLKHLDGQFANPPYDPGNKYTVAYQWGTSGIYLRQQPDEQLAPTWGLIFDPRQQPGPFLLMDDMRATIGAALLYKGHSVNSTDPEHLKEAGAVLLDAKRRSHGFASGVEGKNRVLSQEVRLTMAYNGDAARGMRADANTHYFVPREGGEIWVDNLCIPAKAPHRDMAEKFINYILDPRVGARLSNFNRFATPNAAAKAFINPVDLGNPTIYPPPEIMAKLQFVQDLGKKLRLYDELWTQIKAK
jgi:spermidine/putrescine transport system substrate-binding protein